MSKMQPIIEAVISHLPPPGQYELIHYGYTLWKLQDNNVDILIWKLNEIVWRKNTNWTATLTGTLNGLEKRFVINNIRSYDALSMATLLKSIYLQLDHPKMSVIMDGRHVATLNYHPTKIVPSIPTAQIEYTDTVGGIDVRLSKN